MRRSISAALLLALAAAGTLPVGAQDVDVADGLPAMQGSWEGKIQFQAAGMATSVPKAKVKADCVLAIEQSDQYLTATLTLGGEGAPGPFNLHGEVGNGTFWLQGFTSGLGHPIQIVGSASGQPGSLKAKGSLLVATPEAAGAGKIQVKQQAP